MISKATIDSLVHNILEQLPTGLKQTQADTQFVIKNAVQQTIEKFDLVSKSEFESQVARLHQLQKSIGELEAQINGLKK